MPSPKQLILVVECNEQSKSDYHYICGIIKYFFNFSTIKLTPVYAGNKSRLYNDKTNRTIKSFKRQYNGESIVIVFADYDSSSSSDNNAIKTFCMTNGYDLVWFNKEIEEVVFQEEFDKDKVTAAISFIKNSQAKSININKFSVDCPNQTRFTSNMFLVLSKYLQRKKDCE